MNSESIFINYKKDCAKAQSPPAAGCRRQHLPFRRSVIPQRAFYYIGNEVSYVIKKAHNSGPLISSDKETLLLFELLAQVGTFRCGGCRDFTDPLYLHHSE